MSTAVIKANPQLPAAIAKLLALQTPEQLNELTGGVTSGFPIVSYKGKVWRIRKGGEEIKALDAQGNALPTIEIVLVQANPTLSKIFYEKKFEEGTNEPPRCFSNDGTKPDASVQSPISKVCATCPNNVWGSRVNDSGKKARACSDARRMGVVFANELTEKGTECDKYLLRVPPASLNPLKDFAEKLLAPKGIPFYGIVTRIGFDPNAAHPQMTFKAARFLSEEEAEAIIEIRGSEDMRRILAEAQEFPAAGAASEEESNDAVTPAKASAPVTAATTPAAGKPAKSKPRPATEEEAGIDALLDTPAPVKAKPAAAPPVVEADDEIPPAPVKAKKKAAPVVAAPIEEEEEAPAPAAAKGSAGADFDSLLDTILNG